VFVIVEMFSVWDVEALTLSKELEIFMMSNKLPALEPSNGVTKFEQAKQLLRMGASFCSTELSLCHTPREGGDARSAASPTLPTRLSLAVDSLDARTRGGSAGGMTAWSSLVSPGARCIQRNASGAAQMVCDVARQRWKMKVFYTSMVR